MSVSKWYVIAISAVVALFAVFPLTDTDIWWHLACAREWVTTWTPVREPVVNVHEYFQQTVAFVYNLGGAPLIVAFKAFFVGLRFHVVPVAVGAKNAAKCAKCAWLSSRP